MWPVLKELPSVHEFIISESLSIYIYIYSIYIHRHFIDPRGIIGTIFRGAHNLFNELLRWVPGDGVWYAPHTHPKRNSWSYETDPVSQRRFHFQYSSTAVFFAPLFFLSNYSSLTTERLNISQKERCNQLILRSSPVCARGSQHTQPTWAHISVRLSFVSSHGTSWAPLKKKKTVFFCSSSVCPFSAGGERQSSWSMYFVSLIFLTQLTLRIPDYGHACVLAYQLCALLTIFL